ncbi:AAA family ATPase, partial [Candidatus Poribacteria bacterium]|nr:AAA family ATPase [Candidatus Poribacteria bacterium]
ESDCVTAIRRASDGVLWAGTLGAYGGREEEGGVSRYDPPRSPLTKGGSKGGFVTLTQEDGLADNWVKSIYGDPDGTIWFGTFDGLSRYDGKGFLNFRYDGKGFLNYTLEEGMAFVNAIHRAPDGVLWVGISGSFGARGGVYRYNGKEFVNFTIEDGLASHNVLAIHSDSDGVMWFGMWGDGVYRYDGSVPLEGGGRGGRALVKFTQKDGLVDNAVSSIYRAPDGVMWFGTGSIIGRGGGVAAYDGITWTSLDTRDGLAGDTVLAIHPDPGGSLWFGTEGGVTRYQRSQTPPSVHIVSVKTDQLYTDLEAVPAFTTGSRVTIEYRAIDFKTLPEKRQYRYRIVELDADWRPPTKDTAFDDTLKKAGTYTFEVQAIDRDLNYSEPATLTLHVKRPWWVYAFSGMFIAGIPLAFGAFYFGKRLQTQRAIAQQFNPYIAGRVVGEDLFYGRSDLITDIERTLANNCFLLYGERRIGKTSLQHQLRERLSNAADPTYHFIPAYIDLQGVAEDDFFRTIGSSIVEHAASLFTTENGQAARSTLALRLNEDRERYTYRDLNRDLRTILNHLKENESKTIKLVLLMDEIDTLNTYSLRTNLNLRGLFMGPLKENLVLVMSGLYLKMDWSAEGGGSPPFNFLSREIEIQPLDEDSARKLITEPVKGFYTYEPKAIDLILEYSELRPFTIQGFCLRAVNRVLADGRTKITVSDIEAIKDSVLAELASIRGERAGTALPASLNEALSRITNLETELAQTRKQAV